MTVESESTPPRPSQLSLGWQRALVGLGSACVLGGIAFWVIVLILPARRLPALIADLEARGETFDLEALAPRPIPDDLNAAVPLKAAFAELHRVSTQEQEATAAVVGHSDWRSGMPRGS